MLEIKNNGYVQMCEDIRVIRAKIKDLYVLNLSHTEEYKGLMKDYILLSNRIRAIDASVPISTKRSDKY